MIFSTSLALDNDTILDIPFVKEVGADEFAFIFSDFALLLILPLLSILAITIINTPFYFSRPICLYKQGLIDLSFILQAVKCHAASGARNVVANPTAR